MTRTEAEARAREIFLDWQLNCHTDHFQEYCSRCADLLTTAIAAALLAAVEAERERIAIICDEAAAAAMALNANPDPYLMLADSLRGPDAAAIRARGK